MRCESCFKKILRSKNMCKYWIVFLKPMTKDGLIPISSEPKGKIEVHDIYADKISIKYLYNIGWDMS
jgi:hypothetical protein